MPLNREERKLLHQKSKQPTFGTGKPDSREGHDGDISFRKVEGSGTVEYVKENNDWVAVASSGEMPAVRIVGGSGGSSTSTGSGVTDHGALNGLNDDDHTQYLLIDGTRAMTSVVTIGADSDGTDRSITWGHSTLKTIMGIDDSSDAFVINTDAAFDATLANNSFSIDASHNVIIAGDVSVGDDLLFTSSGAVINWNSGDVTLTHSANTITVAGGTFAAAAITGTTIDASTDFTIGGTVITDATITDDGNFTIDAVGDIILDANGADISFKDNNTHPLVFTNSSGSWVIDSSTASSTLDLQVRTVSAIKMDESGVIYTARYDTAYGTIITHGATTVAANYQKYKLHVLGDTYFYTQGEGDFEQNYSMISSHEEVATGVTYPGE